VSSFIFDEGVILNFRRVLFMTTEPLVILGVVHNGVVIPRGGAVLPEGAEVQITLSSIPPELQADFKAWENLGNEAWNMIADWER
jgi:hypothetical protein